MYSITAILYRGITKNATTGWVMSLYGLYEKIRYPFAGVCWAIGDGLLMGKNKITTGEWFNNASEFLCGVFLMISTGLFLSNKKGTLWKTRAGCTSGIMGCIAWGFDPKMQTPSGMASIGLIIGGLGINTLLPEAQKLSCGLSKRFRQSLRNRFDWQNLPNNSATAMMFLSRAPLAVTIVQNRDYVLGVCLVAWMTGDIALCNPPLVKTALTLNGRCR